MANFLDDQLLELEDDVEFVPRKRIKRVQPMISRQDAALAFLGIAPNQNELTEIQKQPEPLIRSSLAVKDKQPEEAEFDQVPESPTKAPQLGHSPENGVAGSILFPSGVHRVEKRVTSPQIQKVIVNSETAVKAPRRNLQSSLQLAGRTKVFRNVPQTESLSVISKEKKFYLKLKKKSWKEDISNDFASQNIVSMASTQSYNRFHGLINTVRAKVELEKKNAQSTQNARKVPCVVNDLWVEKFRPSGYLDLLSDEAVNRTLLFWLKLWDWVVFRREPKTISATQNQPKKRMQNGKFPFVPRKYAVSDACFAMDDDKRPRFKAVLLCGQPGLGKTTLAHVIAKHAGYDTLEINASDDRTLELFRNRVESTVMSGNVSMDDFQGNNGESKKRFLNRPKCLVIDEIDGAPANTVEYLVSLLKGEAKSSAVKKKSKKKVGLWRPIICICNDQYAPALRSLRQNVIILRFPTIHRDRLSQRLLEICRGVQLQVDSTTLYSLCEKSEDDIRTCLNSLQFASIQGNKLSSHDIHLATMGCKDHKKQLFDIWNAIFKQSTVLKRTSLLVEKDRILGILNLLEQGDLDKIISGLNENYISIPQRSTTLKPVSQCADWMGIADLFEKGIMQEQNWFLMGYRRFYPVAIHVLLSATNVPMLQYPVTQSNCYRQSVENREMLEKFRRKLSPTMFRTHSINRMSLEILPYLTTILQPQFKGTSIYLLTARDTSALKNLVDIMIGYGLSYKEDVNPDSTRTLNLDPDFDRFSSYSEMQAPCRMTTSVREMVLREVQIRRIDTARFSDDGEITQKSKPSLFPTKPTEAGPALPVAAKSKGVSKLQVWSVYDYFRQQNPSQAEKPAGNSGAGSKEKGNVTYRYKEGYSNAVVRDIKIKDLM